MHLLNTLFKAAPLLMLLFAGKVGAQSGQTYFTIPVADTGVNFSDSQFQTILATGTGYVSLGLCKTISLTGMCTGIVASFKNEQGFQTCFHRYFDCDSVAAIGAASGVVSPDGYLVMAYMAFEPLYPTFSGDLYLYIIKASLSNPGTYTTHRVIVPDAYEGGSYGFNITQASTRILLNADGTYTILVPAANRAILFRMSSAFQILSSKKIFIPAGQYGPYKRAINVSFSNIAAMPSGDALLHACYEVIDTTINLAVGGGTIISRFGTAGAVQYTRVYEASPVSNGGFVPFASQLCILPDGKIVAAGESASGAVVYSINPAAGTITNAKWLEAPLPATFDSNNYSGNLGISNVGQSLLLYRIVTNYSLGMDNGQVGVIKVDTNLNLLATRKYSFSGDMSMFWDNYPTSCTSNDGAGIVMSINANGLTRDSNTFSRSMGELVSRVSAAGMATDCAEREYATGDLLLPAPAAVPYSIVVNTAAVSYTTQLRTNIHHDISTAFYQRNVCLPIPRQYPASVANTNRRSLKVYPNPTSGFITIDCPQTITGAALYTLTGSKILSVRAGTVKSIDCSAVATGLYILRLTGSDGTVFVQKISRL